MTVMLELRAGHARLDELIAFVRAHANGEAQLYRSTDGPARLVVIDPAGQGIPYVPPELLASPPHHWTFEPI